MRCAVAAAGAVYVFWALVLLVSDDPDLPLRRRVRDALLWPLWRLLRRRDQAS